LSDGRWALMSGSTSRRRGRACHTTPKTRATGRASSRHWDTDCGPRVPMCPCGTRGGSSSLSSGAAGRTCTSTAKACIPTWGTTTAAGTGTRSRRQGGRSLGASATARRMRTTMGRTPTRPGRGGLWGRGTVTRSATATTLAAMRLLGLPLTTSTLGRAVARAPRLLFEASRPFGPPRSHIPKGGSVGGGAASVEGGYESR
jgi:hypothetical protein